MLAANTASALPCFTPSTKCCTLPTPPEAITGMSTASLMARVKGRLKPILVPSLSMLVSKISPAPRACMLRAHSTASKPVSLRPPWVNTSQRLLSALTALASMATTMACEPKKLLASLTKSGLVTAAVLMLALSAPALSKRRTSATARTPPPTVNGMNTWLATRSITCKMVSRLSELAVMSKKVISSAPSSL